MKKTIKNAMSSLTAKLAALLLTFTCAGTAWGALSGTGTSADDPFLIGTLADLQEFRDAVNAGNAYAGKYVKLTADIDLDNAKWTPIANNGDSTKFGGTFDGDSHTISNFYIDETTPAYHATGFFGAINGTIKNLKFVNAKVAGISSGPATVNGIAVVVGAMPYGGMIDNVSVQNATVDGNRYVGAIVGYVQGTVKNCTVRDVTVTATPDKLSGSYDNGDKAGLIAGYSNPPSTITGNKLYGTLNVTAFGDVAGILGYGHSSDIVTGNEICDEANLTVTVDRVTGWYDRNRTSSTRVGGGLANSADIAENNGISTTAAAIVNPITSAVAQIGTVQYGTLEAATRAYQSGDTIELVGDASSMTAPEGWVINAGTPPTLTVDPFTTYTKVVDGFYQNAATYKDSTDFYITNLNGLKFFRDFVNGDATVVEDYVSRGFSGYTSGLQLFQNNIFQGKTVHLLSDIDLAGEQWVAIGYQDVDSKGLKNLYFYGTFDAGIYDGNGTLTGRHKISNLDVAESYAADGPSLKRTYTGLFGLLAGGTATGVKNLTIENATVAGRQYVGAVVGRIYNGGAVVENCQVIGTININGSSAWVGGLVGECRGSIKDSSVSATGTISGLYDVGGLAGGLYQYNTGAGKEVEISNSAVSNVTVSAGYAYGLGGLVGVAGLAGDGYTSNATISANNANNVTVTTDDTNYAGDGLMGVLVGYANENKAYAVLEDNTITGTTSANENGTAITTQIGADNENTSIVGKEITFDESGKVTAGIFENIPESAIASGYLATDNPDTTTSADYPLTIGGPYVAQIGNNYYPTLAAAFAAAQDGDTIKLIADLTQDNGVVFDKANANVTLDLNGKTFTVNKGANCNNRAIRIDNGTLTVTNGSIVAVGSGTTSSDGAGCYGAFRVESAGTLYAENVNLSNARPWGLNVKVIGGKAYLTNVTINSSYGGGIEVTEASLGDHSQAGYAELTGCTFTQTGYFDHCSTALSVSGGSELVVNSGTYTSENYGLYVFSSGGNITVKGGTFTGNKAAVKAAIDTNTYPNYTGAVQISGGTFTGALDVTSPASMAVSGGNFDRQVPANYCAKDYVPTTEPVLIDNVPYYTVTTMGVAKIERTGEATQYFSTLEAAIEAASAGDTVTLIADISDLSTVTVNAGQNVTLDLNGHTIEAGLKQAGRHYYAIDNYGTFTLKDSSESQTGKIRARGIENLGNGVMIVDGGIIEAIDTNGGAAIWNEGTLTMNGGVLRATHVGSSSDTYGPGALNNRGTATITKADIQSANKRTYAIVSSGAITINPAKDDDVIVAGAHGGLAVDSGTATVTGGKFSSTEYYGLYVSNDGTGTAAKAQVTVSGGEFTGNTQSVHIGSDVNTPVDSVIAISGGTFHGTIFAENKVTEDGGISVSGGSFENPVPEAYCADGYIPNAEQDSETGMYTVKDGTYVAQIGTTKYESLAEAVAAVKAAASGERTTVTLLTNTTEVIEIDFTYPILIDGQGFGISQAAASAHTGIKITAPHADVIIQNATVGNANVGRAVNILGAEGVTLLIKDSALYGNYYPLNVYPNGAAGVDNENITVTNSVISGPCALNLWGTNGVVKVVDSTLSATNTWAHSSGADGNDFGVIVLEGLTSTPGANGYNIEIKGSTIEAAQTTGNMEHIVLFNPNSQGNTVKLDGCVISRNGDTTHHPVIDEEANTSGNSLYVRNTTDAATSAIPVLPDGYAYANADSEGWRLVIKPVVAVIAADGVTTNGVYATLADAFAAARTDETIELLVDLTENFSYTEWASLRNKSLALAGNHTLTSTREWFGYYFGDYDSGNRPETDRLAITNVTFAKSGGNYTLLFDGVAASLNGVTVNGSANTALSYANGATGVLENVTVANTGSHSATWRNAAISLQSIAGGAAQLLVKSGSYTSENGYAAYIFSSGGILTIDGGDFVGKFCANIDRNSYHNDYNQSWIYINGGKFKDVAFETAGDDAYCGYVISGGVFDAKPDASFAAPGYCVIPNTDPATSEAYPWTVAGAVASITVGEDTIYYATLEEAIVAANAAGVKVITILDDSITASPDSSWFVLERTLVLDEDRDLWYVEGAKETTYPKYEDALAAANGDATIVYCLWSGKSKAVEYAIASGSLVVEKHDKYEIEGYTGETAGFLHVKDARGLASLAGFKDYCDANCRPGGSSGKDSNDAFYWTSPAKWTVVLDCNIDLDNKAWTTSQTGMWIKIDGDNHTVLNLSVSTSSGKAGLFTDCGLVSNLKLDGANVDAGSGTAGAVVAWQGDGGLVNVVVSNAVVSGKYVGGLVGQAYGRTYTGNVVGNVSVTTTTKYVGGIAGQFYVDGNTLYEVDIQNNALNDIQIAYSNPNEIYGSVLGALISASAPYVVTGNTANNITTNGTLAVRWDNDTSDAYNALWAPRRPDDTTHALNPNVTYANNALTPHYLSQFVYPIEGTAGVPVASEWLAAQFPSIYPDATKPIPASITDDLVTALSENGANNMPKWESYVLGLNPADPTAVLRLGATAKDATTVTITGAIDTTKFPSISNVTVTFRLAAQNGAEWTDIATGAVTPSFDVPLDDVAGKVLAIFADIVTE